MIRRLVEAHLFQNTAEPNPAQIRFGFRNSALRNCWWRLPEATEAFFSMNDFYPFTRDELKRHDPTLFELLEAVWK